MTVAFTDGVITNLTEGPNEYNCNEEVSYQFSLYDGYEDLTVLLDGEPVEPEGIITINETHLLAATAKRIPKIRNETEPLKDTLEKVMSGMNPAENFQEFIYLTFDLFENNPDSAVIWLEDLDNIVNEKFTEQERNRIDEELSGKMFFINRPSNSNKIVNAVESNISTRETDVVFINGIWNTRTMARNSSILLHRATKEAGLSNYINSFILNPSKVDTDNKLRCFVNNLYDNLTSCIHPTNYILNRHG